MNMKQLKSLFLFTIFIGLIISYFSCKSTSAREKPINNTTNDDVITLNESLSEILKESALLNVVIRRLGTEQPISISILNGSETRWVKIEKPAKEIPELISQIANVTNMSIQNSNNYFFLYPAEQTIYENMTALSMEGLPNKYDTIIVSAAFGTGTQLFNVFNSLNFTYGCNIVADNSIAELPSGEIVISNLPLSVALEMILKSARIVPQNLKYCATDNFIFYYSILNNRKNDLENCKAFENETKNPLLEKEVLISLPKPVTLNNRISLPFYYGAEPLSKVVSVIANQTGLSIEIMPGTEMLPVNPCYLNKLKLKTALDLITFQWLDKTYIYTIKDETIVFMKSGQ